MHLVAESTLAMFAPTSSTMGGKREGAGRKRALKVRGPVWGDRYDARELTTPRAVRDALVYVLMNAKKHRLHVGRVDRFSSAPWFDGFVGRPELGAEPCPVSASKTWLGSAGWRRHGLVSFDERPRTPD